MAGPELLFPYSWPDYLYLLAAICYMAVALLVLQPPAPKRSQLRTHKILQDLKNSIF